MSPIVTMQRPRCGPGPDSFTPHLPSGLAQYTDATFVGMDMSYPPDAEGLAAYNSGGLVAPEGLLVAPSGTLNNGSVDADGSAPYGPYVLQYGYPGTPEENWEDVPLPSPPEENGSGVGNISTSINNVWLKSYVAFGFKTSPDYVVHSYGEKLIYTYFNCPGQTGSAVGSVVTDIISHNSTSRTNIGLYVVEQLESGTVGRYGGAVYLNVSGGWNLVEQYTQMNTPGNADGIVRIWINGVLAFERTAYRFSQLKVNGTNPNGDTTQGSIQGFNLNSTRGGGISIWPKPAAGQTRYVNRLALHTSDTL